MTDTITYTNYLSLDQVQRNSLIEHLINKKVSNTQDKFKHLINPNWLPALYCNLMFPNLVHNDLVISLNENNILEGELILEELNGCSIKMKWDGYVSQLYDGELFLAVIDNNETIEGNINEHQFKFVADKLVSGKWPGFLVINS